VAKTLQDIQNVKQEKIDRLIVYTHWGKEFTDVPEADIRNLAHQFIDAGADLIIGSHPHVIQSQEEYRGKKIYYSLGNFIFDQFFDPRTQKGLVVTAEIQAGVDGIKLQESAAQMKTSGQTVLEITQ
jgi:poly-gamma-glutamate synthesis protein (capsule biosynthesis protein)